MLKVSKLADYAVVVLATLAQSDSALMTASGISGKTGLPEPTVAKVLKLLARDGILNSERGVNGGYKMARPPNAINVAQIVTAVDGPISLTACVDTNKEGETCFYENRCAVKGRWNGVNFSIRSAMQGVTLADMITGGVSCESNEIKMPAEMNS